MSMIKQIVTLSGKGGTGKTSFTAALAHLAAIDSGSNSHILVDADVDAANLSLLLKPEHSAAYEFLGWFTGKY